MNLKIKFRESFRPFAPTVLKEKVGEYFEIDRESPYMLMVASVRKEKQLSLYPEQENFSGFEKLKIKRSVVPAITHVDYSARIQTIAREDNLLYYDMINAFYNLTGCPIVINTSFNIRGEPIVCAPKDAFNCFMRTEMDYLIMGKFLLDKGKQPPSLVKKVSKVEFELD